MIFDSFVGISSAPKVCKRSSIFNVGATVETSVKGGREGGGGAGLAFGGLPGLLFSAGLLNLGTISTGTLIPSFSSNLTVRGGNRPGFERSDFINLFAKMIF